VIVVLVRTTILIMATRVVLVPRRFGTRSGDHAVPANQPPA